MRIIRFHSKTNRSDNLLHIETDGAVINIRVGLTDSNGNPVTRVDVIPDGETRGGDGLGRVWDITDDSTPYGVRILHDQNSERERGRRSRSIAAATCMRRM